MGSSYPTVDEIIQNGAPPEWLPFVIIGSAIVLCLIVLDIFVFIKHKKYSTKYPIQFICVIGILQVFPVYACLNLVGIVVPRASDFTVFMSESYEAITFILFMRLVFTYMGGKKIYKRHVEGDKIHLNLPPCCCLVCLPQISISKCFFIFCEALIGLYVVFCIVFGFIKLIMNLDGSEAYPSNMITTTFGNYYHAILLVLLFAAIYGLSGIYHSSEEALKHRGIVRKFLVYKIFTVVAKAEDVTLGSLGHHGIISSDDFGYNEYWTAGLRLRMIVFFAVIVQALIMFPLAITFFTVEGYMEKTELPSSPNVINRKGLVTQSTLGDIDTWCDPHTQVSAQPQKGSYYKLILIYWKIPEKFVCQQEVGQN
eukprot:sb/3465874/